MYCHVFITFAFVSQGALMIHGSAHIRVAVCQKSFMECLEAVVRKYNRPAVSYTVPVPAGDYAGLVASDLMDIIQAWATVFSYNRTTPPQFMTLYTTLKRDGFIFKPIADQARMPTAEALNQSVVSHTRRTRRTEKDTVSETISSQIRILDSVQRSQQPTGEEIVCSVLESLQTSVSLLHETLLNAESPLTLQRDHELLQELQMQIREGQRRLAETHYESALLKFPDLVEPILAATKRAENVLQLFANMTEVGRLSCPPNSSLLDDTVPGDCTTIATEEVAIPLGKSMSQVDVPKPDITADTFVRIVEKLNAIAVTVAGMDARMCLLEADMALLKGNVTAATTVPQQPVIIETSIPLGTETQSSADIGSCANVSPTAAPTKVTEDVNFLVCSIEEVVEEEKEEEYETSMSDNYFKGGDLPDAGSEDSDSDDDDV
jgi:hypothetical protein